MARRASCWWGRELAKHFTDDPLYVAGIGQASGRGLNAADDLTYFEATRYAANEAYEMSGLGPADIQFAEVHDCFSIAELLHIEDLGFFKPGEGYKAVADGLTRLDGEKPINTSGGLKCKGHPVGATGGGAVNRGMGAVEVQGRGQGCTGQRSTGRCRSQFRWHRRHLHFYYSGEEITVADRPISDYQFERFLEEGKLMGARCGRVRCPFCAATRYLPQMPRLRDGVGGNKGRGATGRFYLYLNWAPYDGRGGV